MSAVMAMTSTIAKSWVGPKPFVIGQKVPDSLAPKMCALLNE